MRSGTRLSARNSIVSSSPASVAGSSGTATTSQPQSGAALRLERLTLNTSCAGARGQFDFARVHAVDGDAMPDVDQCFDGLSDLPPGFARVAA